MQLYSDTQITLGCNSEINNLTFDGSAYFCTIQCKCEILKLDGCFHIQSRYNTCREYECICYDWCEHCFWASAKNGYGKLFKLDCKMNEIDCIELVEAGICGAITGVSYNCYEDTLFVSYAHVVVEVKKECRKSTVFHTGKFGWITGVLCVYPYIFLTVLKDQHYTIQVFTSCGEKIHGYCVEEKLILKNLIFNPCKHPEIEALVFKRYCYPYLYRSEICFHSLGGQPACCNYEICKESCSSGHSCHNRNACTDVIESIALIEASLSHILNAEGEKIQKIVAETDDIDKILCVNREVNKTIINATHLEHVLHAKLSEITSCGLCADACCNDHHCADHSMDHCLEELGLGGSNPCCN